jgi:hypothetical protein
MSKLSRDKGLRIEREIVSAHAELGIAGERVPLSGAARYRGNGADVDIYPFGPDAPPLRCEVKARTESFSTAPGQLCTKNYSRPIAHLINAKSTFTARNRDGRDETNPRRRVRLCLGRGLATVCLRRRLRRVLSRPIRVALPLPACGPRRPLARRATVARGPVLMPAMSLGATS